LNAADGGRRGGARGGQGEHVEQLLIRGDTAQDVENLIQASVQLISRGVAPDQFGGPITHAPNVAGWGPAEGGEGERVRGA